MIYLLDLNYTLVGNSPERGSAPIRPFIRQIEQEEYRQWLVELLRPHQVILITARPDSYREPTLTRIQEQTGWQPEAAFFAEIRNRPPQIKQHLLETHIFPRYGRTGFYGLESNPRTRSMYEKFGIASEPVTDPERFRLPA
ncbi:MAG: hypothetical protein Q7P63_01220 [Verrucomicrobiota bacterium JB022]|nr:hypothetical protein [Verrucomicrobiota bacterium JB022]